MKVAEALRAIQALPVGGVSDLTRDRPFLVLAPHSDDETLGCGGLLAQTAASGAGRVVILTDGARSHPGSRAVPRERLIGLRQEESVAALSRLGLHASAVSFLGLPDTALPHDGRGFEEAVEAVVDLARRWAAETLFVTWSHDPHCDHEAASAIACAAARALGPVKVWAYPIWGLHLDPHADIAVLPPSGWRLAIADEQDRKREALACYASQMTALIDDDPDGFCFTEAQLTPFLDPFETFMAIDP